VASELSAALRALLAERVDSFEKLELVMVLYRAPGQRASVRDLATALDLDRDEVRAIAFELTAGGLVRTNPTTEIRLEPTTPDDRAVLDELATAYDRDKIEVVKQIAESAMNRLRNLAGRAFADAFVIGKKPGGKR
jgi:DNA-binding IclR family transcriptional regulator